MVSAIKIDAMFDDNFKGLGPILQTCLESLSVLNPYPQAPIYYAKSVSFALPSMKLRKAYLLTANTIR